MTTKGQLELHLLEFTREMFTRGVVTQRDIDDIQSAMDLFITAAEQNTSDPSLTHTPYRDEVTEELYELLTMWIDWRHFTGKDKLV